MTSSSLLSKLTVCAIGLTCKTFMNIGYCSSVKVKGLDVLLEALQSEERDHGRGVMTISNHVSTLDDPVTWGILPASYYFNTRTTRWVLGASDIMFINPVLSEFFRKGQVIETFRGNGIFQPAVDLAIEKVNEGAWVHLFGEGKVNQPLKRDIETSTPRQPLELLRFKWGLGRVLMEARQPPIIIPMWLTGFDKLMPEGRSPPFNFLPKPNVDLSITFGQPINNEDIETALKSSGDVPQTLKTPVLSVSSEVQSEKVAQEGWLGDAIRAVEEKDGRAESTVALATETERIRSAVTAVLQGNVEALGRKVLGGS